MKKKNNDGEFSGIDNIGTIRSFAGVHEERQYFAISSHPIPLAPSLNEDVHYDLPPPSLELVARINALAPDDSELEPLDD